MTPEKHWTPAELAERLDLEPATLAMWRVRGVGPRFLKFGSSKQARVRYPESEILAWEATALHANTGAIS